MEDWEVRSQNLFYNSILETSCDFFVSLTTDSQRYLRIIIEIYFFIHTRATLLPITYADMYVMYKVVQYH